MPDDRAINLSFFEGTGIVMAACGIHPDARAAFDARIRQLQRLGLLAGDRESGTKPRIAWGIPELAMLALACRLMAAFMPPTFAARYASERLGDLAPFLLAGGAAALPASYVARRPIDSTCIAVFEGIALQDLGRKRQHDERYDGTLGKIELFADHDAVDIASAAAGAGIVIDSRTFMPAIITGAAQAGMATDEELAFELDRLRYASNPAVRTAERG